MLGHAVAREEVRPGAHDHGLFVGRALRLQRGEARAQGEPHEEAAVGPPVAGVRAAVPVERVAEAVELARVDGAQPLHVAVEVAAADDLGHGAPQVGARAHVVAHRRHAVDERGRGQVPAQPQPRGDDLGEGGHLDGQLAAGEGEERGRRLAPEPDLPVGVVLHERQAVLARQLQQAFAARAGERHARRVLVRGDAVEQLGAPPLVGQPPQGRLREVHAQAVLVHGHGLDARAEGADGAQAAGEGGALHEHGVAGVEQGLAGDADAVGRAGGDDDAVGGEGQALDAGGALRDGLAQGHGAEDAAVLEGLAPFAFEHRARRPQQLGVGQGGHVGQPPGEGDDGARVGLRRRPRARPQDVRARAHHGGERLLGPEGRGGGGSVGHGPPVWPPPP